MSMRKVYIISGVLMLAVALLNGQAPRVVFTDSARIEIQNTGGSIFVGEYSGVHAPLYSVQNMDTTDLPNIGIGDSTLSAPGLGFWNIGIGHAALKSTISSGNVALGMWSLWKHQDGTYNTAVGHASLLSLEGSSEDYNTAVGGEALRRLKSGDGNTALGAFSLNSLDTGFHNIALGLSALYNLENGNNNIAIGRSAALEDTSGSNNIAIGLDALRGSQNADDLIAIGDSTLASNRGQRNLAIGSKALALNTSGNENLAIGRMSAYHNTTGLRNLSMGYNSLFNNTQGSGNIAIGKDALESNTTSNLNIAIGLQAMSNTNSLGGNVAVGYRALSNTPGLLNTAIGYQAGIFDTIGNYNVYLGAHTDAHGMNGNYNITIGYDVGVGSWGNRNILIGHQAGSYLDSIENRLIINGFSSFPPLIYGEFDTRLLHLSGDLIVGRNVFTGLRTLTILGRQNTSSEDYAHLDFTNVDSGEYIGARISSNNITGTGTGDLRFHTYGDSLEERMVIDNIGQTGIGTANPNSLLHLSDASQPGILSACVLIEATSPSGDAKLSLKNTHVHAGSEWIVGLPESPHLRIAYGQGIGRLDYKR